MTLSRISNFCLALAIASSVASIGFARMTQSPQPPPQQTGNPTPNENGADATSGLPRGKKLVLKNGTFQLVRSYERNGDRVRYFSAERGSWEEIPADMVDWDATAKAEAAQQAQEAQLVKKIHRQEEVQNIQTVTDVDSSLQVAKGVFLPPGEGMFALDGKSVTPITQAGAGMQLDKKRLVEQVLSPIPIVPGKQHVVIAGTRAKVRISTSSPEFYLREAPPDPDRSTPIQKSSRPGESGPEVELVRAKVSGGKRQLATIRTLFGQELSEDQKLISIQRWEVAPSVYRFTLSEQLPPGEYALAEVLPDGLNLYVWDFGVDGALAPDTKSPKH